MLAMVAPTTNCYPLKALILPFHQSRGRITYSSRALLMEVHLLLRWLLRSFQKEDERPMPIAGCLQGLTAQATMCRRLAETSLLVHRAKKGGARACAL